MSETELAEADRLDGAPHPREAAAVFGQGRAEAEFLATIASGRLHHAWLLTGPRGVGKATLAWRMARFLLAEPPAAGDGLFGAPPPPDSLDVAPDHPVARRVAALSEPRLLLLRRTVNEKTGKLARVISVDEVRRLRDFFGLSAAEGGRRVVIVDSADEMNPSAANAILKVLEEPPPDAVLLLVSHTPSRLLPTIRSRCRVLRCDPLLPRDMDRALAQAGVTVPEDDLAAVTELARGSVGDAIRLVQRDGLSLYRQMLGIMAGMPGFDRTALARLAGSVGQGGDAAERAGEIVDLASVLLSRLARAAAGAAATAVAPDETKLWARLGAGPGDARRWADAAQAVPARARSALALNLDPSSVIVDMFLAISETAACTAA
ncbi:MAG: DNA polymerase III subunit delta' [Alphaproteobacteria bacterium]|nr:MAG: DNA polymerase III subunit delta' [Alphaproteobacteria bacterium]